MNVFLQAQLLLSLSRSCSLSLFFSSRSLSLFSFSLCCPLLFLSPSYFWSNSLSRFLSLWLGNSLARWLPRSLSFYSFILPISAPLLLRNQCNTSTFIIVPSTFNRICTARMRKKTTAKQNIHIQVDFCNLFPKKRIIINFIVYWMLLHAVSTLINQTHRNNIRFVEKKFALLIQLSCSSHDLLYRIQCMVSMGNDYEIPFKCSHTDEWVTCRSIQLRLCRNFNLNAWALCAVGALRKRSLLRLWQRCCGCVSFCLLPSTLLYSNNLSKAHYHLHIINTQINDRTQKKAKQPLQTTNVKHIAVLLLDIEDENG